MKIPDKIIIGGIEWSIKLHEDTIKDEATLKLSVNGEDVQKTGSVDFRNAIINLTCDINPQMVDMAFLHETNHVVDFTMGLNEGDKPKIDETYTDARAQIWLQVINQLIECNKTTLMEHIGGKNG